MPPRKNAQAGEPKGRSKPSGSKSPLAEKKEEDDQQEKTATAHSKGQLLQEKKGGRGWICSILSLLFSCTVLAGAVGAGYVYLETQKVLPAVGKDCQVLPGYSGLTDVQFSVDWPGIAFASMDPKEHGFVKFSEEQEQGRILRIDLNEKEPKLEPISMSLYPYKEFRPLGFHLLDLSINPGDLSARMAVVNYREGKYAVEILAAMGAGGKNWVWTKSVESKLFTGIFDVTLLNSHKMYVSNWLAEPLSLGIGPDTLLNTKAGVLAKTKNILRCKGLLGTPRCGIAQTEVNPKGLVASNNGKIYVSETPGIGEYIYDSSGALGRAKQLDGSINAVYLNTDKYANLYAAGPTSPVLALLHTFEKSLLGTSSLSLQSEVKEYDLLSDTEPELLYRGSDLNLITSADVYSLGTKNRKYMVAGSLYDEGLLFCKINF